MKIRHLLFAIVFCALQSCHVPVTRDYSGLSGALVFSQNKKWIVNNLSSDLSSAEKENLNQKILSEFQSLSNGNAISINQINSKTDLFPSKIPFNPSLEDLENLKKNTDYDFLVNVSTKKVRDQISSLEIYEPLEYSKNEAFALLEVYDLKTLKKIYSQKASSSISREAQAPIEMNRPQNENKSSPTLNYSTDALSKKNLNKILKDIRKKAVR